MTMDTFDLVRLQASLSSEEQVRCLKNIHSFLRNDPCLDIARTGPPRPDAAPVVAAAESVEDRLPRYLKKRPTGTGFLGERWAAMKREQSSLHEEQEKLLGQGIKQDVIASTVSPPGPFSTTAPAPERDQGIPTPTARRPTTPSISQNDGMVHTQAVREVSPARPAAREPPHPHLTPRRNHTPSANIPLHLSGTAGLPASPASPLGASASLVPQHSASRAPLHITDADVAKAAAPLLAASASTAQPLEMAASSIPGADFTPPVAPLPLSTVLPSTAHVPPVPAHLAYPCVAPPPAGISAVPGAADLPDMAPFNPALYPGVNLASVSPARARLAAAQPLSSIVAPALSSGAVGVRVPVREGSSALCGTVLPASLTDTTTTPTTMLDAAYLASGGFASASGRYPTRTPLGSPLSDTFTSGVNAELSATLPAVFVDAAAGPSLVPPPSHAGVQFSDAAALAAPTVADAAVGSSPQPPTFPTASQVAPVSTVSHGAATRSVATGTAPPTTPMFVARRMSSGLRASKQYRAADQFVPPEDTPRPAYSYAPLHTQISAPYGASHVTIQEVLSSPVGTPLTPQSSQRYLPAPPPPPSATPSAFLSGAASSMLPSPLDRTLTPGQGVGRMLRGSLAGAHESPGSAVPVVPLDSKQALTQPSLRGESGSAQSQGCGRQTRTWSPPPSPSRQVSAPERGKKASRAHSPGHPSRQKQSRLTSPTSENPFAINPFDLPRSSDVSPAPEHQPAAAAARPPPSALSVPYGAGFDEDLVRQLHTATAKHWGR